jgi:hypothetical protein
MRKKSHDRLLTRIKAGQEIAKRQEQKRKDKREKRKNKRGEK